jgi:hypothetical protein
MLYLRLSKYGSTQGRVKLSWHSPANSPKEMLVKPWWEAIFGQQETLRRF